MLLRVIDFGFGGPRSSRQKAVGSHDCLLPSALAAARSNDNRGVGEVRKGASSAPLFLKVLRPPPPSI
jgi:hypothetical protein